MMRLVVLRNDLQQGHPALSVLPAEQTKKSAQRKPNKIQHDHKIHVINCECHSLFVARQMINYPDEQKGFNSNWFS